MLSLIQNILRFFNVELIKHELAITEFDYLNNIITIRKTEQPSTGRSLINSQIYTAQIKEKPILSVKKIST